MKFAADEGVDGRLVHRLRDAGHDVWYYAEEDQGSSDDLILQKAAIEERVLLTRDKDFGELVYRDKMLHTGIILFRLEKLSSAARVPVAFVFIAENLDNIPGHDIVLQPGSARVRRL